MTRHHLALRGTVALVLTFLVHGVLSARRVETWSYERLMRESDLVVIAEMVASADTGGCVRLGAWDIDFPGVNTDFKVSLVLKGKLKGDTLRVLHFRQPKDVRIANGPGLVSFQMKGMEFRTKKGQFALYKPSYLLFLTKRKDGRFEPVSGRIDPVKSVRELHRPFPAESDDMLSK